MSKVLELLISDGKIEGTSDDVTYTVKNHGGEAVSIRDDGAYDFSGADNTHYGFVDLNTFHDSNKAFSFEVTLTDRNQDVGHSYNYFAIGRKTYARVFDVVTVGVDAAGFVCIGVISHGTSVKCPPLMQLKAPFVDAKVQLNYDPTASVQNRVTLYVNGQKCGNLGEVVQEVLVEILDAHVFFGTSGTTNEEGHDSKFDLSRNITFTESIKFFSGVSLDPTTTYFVHNTFSNPGNANENFVCNGEASERIRVTIQSENPLIDSDDILVTIANEMDADFVQEPATYIEGNADEGTYTFEFANLDKIVEDEGYIKYKVVYLGKEFSIEPETNKMWRDTLKDTLEYQINDVSSDSVTVELLGITDGGNFLNSLGRTDYRNYKLKLIANKDGADIVKEFTEVAINSTYVLDGLDDGLYYNISATLTDPAGNQCDAVLPNAPREGILVQNHYTNTTIRTVDVTQPGPFTSSINEHDGLEFGFKLTNVKDNGDVDATNKLTLFYLTTGTELAEENIISTVERDGVRVDFDSNPDTYVIAKGFEETNATTYLADKTYYLYAILKDRDSNYAIATNGDDKFTSFFEENEITYKSMSSSNTIDTICKDDDDILIEFSSKHVIEDTSVLSVKVNNFEETTPTLASADKQNWTLTYSMASDVLNESREQFVTAEVRYDGILEVKRANNSGVAGEVMLRGSSVTRSVAEVGGAFTVVNENDISSANHKSKIDPVGNDKIVEVSGLKMYEVCLYTFDSYYNEVDAGKKQFTSLDDIDTTITFSGLKEGETYGSKVRIVNNLDQEYTVILETDIQTKSTDPIQSTFAIESVILSGKSRPKITGLVVNDVNSDFELFTACIHTNIPDKDTLTEEQVVSFFDMTSGTRRFDDLPMNVPFDAVANKATTTNDDGSMKTDELTTFVKGYDFSTGQVSDFPDNLEKVLVVGMVKDKSVQGNTRSFFLESETLYMITNVTVKNNNKVDSKFIKVGDTLDLEFTINFKLTVDAINVTYYDQDYTPTTADDGFTWTSTLTVPSGVGDQGFVKDNLQLYLTTGGNTEPMDISSYTDLSVDISGPQWSFGTVSSTGPGEFLVPMKLINEFSRSEAIQVEVVASNNGSNALPEDAGKTLVTFTDTADFSTLDELSFVVSGLSEGLDYTLSGSLTDVNGNQTYHTYVNPAVDSGVIYTKDSVLPVITAILSSDGNKQVTTEITYQDTNSRVEIVAMLSTPGHDLTLEEMQNAGNAGAEMLTDENQERGQQKVANGIFTKYIAADYSEQSIQDAVEYQLNVAAVQIDQNFDIPHMAKFTHLTEYPIDPDFSDPSGTTGVLTHFMNYETESPLNGMTGFPSPFIDGVGRAEYVEGITKLGTKAIVLNSAAADSHSLKCSAETINTSTDFTFATFFKADASVNDAESSLFYYDDAHYLTIRSGFIKFNWGYTTEYDLSVDMTDFNAWNHIALTATADADGTNSAPVALYFNGSAVPFEKKVGEGNSTALSGQTFFQIGSLPNVSGQVFKGMLDNTRIYASILDITNVNLLYNQTSTQIEISFEDTGAMVFTTSSGQVLTQAEVDAMVDSTNTATEGNAINFDGDTSIEVSGDSLDASADGAMADTTVSFWIEPTADTFTQEETTLVEYFADVGYTVTVDQDGQLSFNVVDNANPDHPLVGDNFLIRSVGFGTNPLPVLYPSNDFKEVIFSQDGSRGDNLVLEFQKVTGKPNTYLLYFKQEGKYWKGPGGGQLLTSVDGSYFIGDGASSNVATVTQVGNTLIGDNQFDQLGWYLVLSSDGTRMAVGARLHDEVTSNEGLVRVYDYNSSTSQWVQIGQDINGVAQNERFGSSLAMSADGSRIAVGAPNHDSSRGTVRVYDYNTSTSQWVQVGGDIDGHNVSDQSGYSLEMSSDGTRVAIGSPAHDSGRGEVRVFDYNATTSQWNQVGGNIDGEALEDQWRDGLFLSEQSLAISSDGSRVAVGAIYNDGGGGNSGHVRVFDYSGSQWVQVGSDIDGEASGDQSGWSVSMSADGARIAVGAVFNDGNDGQINQSGHIRVYDYSGSQWVQVGSDIDGKASTENAGWSMRMSSDGSRLVFGTKKDKVRVYDYSGSEWVQVHNDITGVSGDHFGWCLSISSDGNVIAVGSPYADDSGKINDGEVNVYYVHVPSQAGAAQVGFTPGADFEVTFTEVADNPGNYTASSQIQGQTKWWGYGSDDASYGQLTVVDSQPTDTKMTWFVERK